MLLQAYVELDDTPGTVYSFICDKQGNKVIMEDTGEVQRTVQKHAHSTLATVLLFINERYACMYCR